VRDDDHNSEPSPEPTTNGDPFWDPVTGSFNGPRLHMAIVARGWTLQEFAADAEIREATLYSAVRGRPVQDRTAIRVFRTLAGRQPIRIAS
jgi:hypothetical protein